MCFVLSRVIFTAIAFFVFNTFCYKNYIHADSPVNTKMAKSNKDTKQQKKYKKQVYKKNKKIAKQVIKANKQQCKKDHQCKKTTIKQKIQSHKNIKKITKMDFLDDDKIIALIDEQQKLAMNKKQIQVRVKNKGVPKACLLNSKNISQNMTSGTINNNGTENKKQKELTRTKNSLKEDLKASLIANDVNPKTIDYILDNVKYIKSTVAKNNAVITRGDIESIESYKPTNRAMRGLQLKKQYKKELNTVEQLFYVEPELILAIWAMETDYGTLIGDYPAFNALYSACINASTMARLHYFEDNIIALAMLVDRGYFSRDVISSFDGGIGGCQFMPDSFYKFAVSMNGDKPDIINNNADVFASIGNYMHSMGWRYGEGVITEIEMPVNIDKCLIGFNTSKTVGEWKKLGIKAHPNEIGADFFENNDSKASIIVTDIDKDDVKPAEKRAFLAYDNFKVILGYNQKLRYGITAGLIFEELRNKQE